MNQRDSNQQDPGSRQRSDHVLLASWRVGDVDAGEELFGRYFAPLERFFLNKVSAAAVTDLMQETFTACVEGRNRMSETTRFRSYLFGVAYRVFKQHLRHKYRDAVAADIDEASVAGLSRDPLTVIAERQEHRLLLEALRDISTRYQVILELHYWEQMTTSEIAEILDISPGTARSRLQRARDALEAAITRLALSAEVLESTLTTLDDWAASCVCELASTSRVQGG